MAVRNDCKKSPLGTPLYDTVPPRKSVEMLIMPPWELHESARRVFWFLVCSPVVIVHVADAEVWVPVHAFASVQSLFHALTLSPEQSNGHQVPRG